MILLKCKECGGVVLKNDAMTCKCCTCGKTYDLDYQQLYQEKTNFAIEYGDRVKDLFCSMETSILSILIGAYFNNQYLLADLEEKWYASYEIELFLATLAVNAVESSGKYFGNYPTDTNCINEFSSVIANCQDVIYVVCEKNKDFLSYEWIMQYFSKFINGYIVRALNWGTGRWKRSNHVEDLDGWVEYITVLDNCRIILENLDKYGDVCLDNVYKNLIDIQKTGINLTYIHHYWIGNYRATQDVGLNSENKIARMQRLTKYEIKLKTFERKKNELQEKRRKEEETKKEIEKQERIAKFWEENENLKINLLTEKDECLVQIKKLEEQQKSINADKEISDLREEIKMANSILTSLSFFSFKEKKIKKQQIEKLYKEINFQKVKIDKAKEAIQKEIDSIKKRVGEIDNEFIVDRISK